MATVARASSSLPFPLGSPSALPDGGAAASPAATEEMALGSSPVAPGWPLLTENSTYLQPPVELDIPSFDPLIFDPLKSPFLLDLLSRLPATFESSSRYIFDALFSQAKRLSLEFKDFFEEDQQDNPILHAKITQLGLKALFTSDWCLELFPPGERPNSWENLTKDNLLDLKCRIRAKFPEINWIMLNFNQKKDALTQEIQLFPEGRAFLEKIQYIPLPNDLRCMAMEKWLEERNLNLCYQKWNQVSPGEAPAIPEHLTTESEKAAFAKERLNALAVANSLPTDFSQLGLTRLPQDLCATFRRISNLPLGGGGIHPHDLSRDLDFSYNQIVNLRSEVFRNLYPASAQNTRVVNLTGNRIQSFTGDLGPLNLGLDGKLLPIFSQQQLPLTQLPAAPSGNSFLDREIKRISSHHNLSYLVSAFVKEFLLSSILWNLALFLLVYVPLGKTISVLLAATPLIVLCVGQTLSMISSIADTAQNEDLSSFSSFRLVSSFFDPLRSHSFSLSQDFATKNFVFQTAKVFFAYIAYFFAAFASEAIIVPLFFLCPTLALFFNLPLQLSVTNLLTRAVSRAIGILGDRYVCKGTLLLT